MYTEIYKHPLRNAYCLAAIGLGIPPFIGSLNQCKKLQPKWENNIAKLLNNDRNTSPANTINQGRK